MVLLFLIFSIVLFGFAVFFKTVLFCIENFDNFVEIGVPLLSYVASYAVDPQHIFVEGCRLDFIGKEENFNDDFKSLCDKFEIPHKKHDTNITSVRTSNSLYKYIHKFSQAQIDFVNKKYERDFKIFGYEMVHDIDTLKV